MYEDDFEDERFDDEEPMSAPEFAAALRGDFGAGPQQRAMELVGWEGEAEEVDDDEAWDADFDAAADQLENRLGRALTTTEENRLVRHFEAGDPPTAEQLSGAYREIVGRDPSGGMRDKESRQAAGREAYADAQEALADEGRLSDGSPDPDLDPAPVAAEE